MRVKQRKVRNYNGNRKSDGQHPGQSAQRTDEHTDVRLGRHVTVAYGCHGYNSPPQPDRDRCEIIIGVGLDTFRIEDERGEDNDTEDEEEDKEGQLVSGRLEGVDEDLEPRRVSGEFEQPHDADDAEELEDVVLLFEMGEQDVEVE